MFFVNANFWSYYILSWVTHVVNLILNLRMSVFRPQTEPGTCMLLGQLCWRRECSYLKSEDERMFIIFVITLNTIRDCVAYSTIGISRSRYNHKIKIKNTIKKGKLYLQMIYLHFSYIKKKISNLICKIPVFNSLHLALHYIFTFASIRYVPERSKNVIWQEQAMTEYRLAASDCYRPQSTIHCA